MRSLSQTHELQMMSAAATTLQSAVHSWISRRELASNNIQYRQTTSAATKLQATFRSYRFRRGYAQNRLQDVFKMQSTAATLIQAMTRSWSCRKITSDITQRAVTIQRSYRKFQRSRLQKNVLQRSEYTTHLLHRREISASINIQTTYRSWAIRRKLLAMKAHSQLRKETNAAVTIQSNLPMFLCRRYSLVMKEIASKQELKRNVDDVYFLPEGVTKVQGPLRLFWVLQQLLSLEVPVSICFGDPLAHCICVSSKTLSCIVFSDDFICPIHSSSQGHIWE